jgi:Holliday junction resolvasome RuvABC endonuclease subunit
MSDGFVMGLGFDPGFATTGVGAVALLPDGRHISAGVELIITEKNKDKRFEHLRVASDDVRRLLELYERACAAIERVKPKVVGVENYTIFESREYERLRDRASELMGFLGIVKGQLPPEVLELEKLTAVLALDGRHNEMVNKLAALGKAVDDFRIQRGRGQAAKTYGSYTAVCCAAARYGIPVYPFMPLDLKKFCGKNSASKEEVIASLGGRVEGLAEKVAAKIRAKSVWNHVYDATGHGMMALREYMRWMRDGVRQEPMQGNLPLEEQHG